MKTRYFSIPLCWLALLALPLAGTAQTQVTPALPAYKSAFEGYQPFTDDKTVNWKEANDNVARIGGWRAYAKQAQEVDSKPSNTPLPAARPGETVLKGKP